MELLIDDGYEAGTAKKDKQIAIFSNLLSIYNRSITPFVIFNTQGYFFLSKALLVP